jgi:hypothetical protein
MHRQVMLICALALGTAVTGAPHPQYAATSDPYAYPSAVDPYPTDPYPSDPYVYPSSTPYVDPDYTSYVDPGYYSTPTSDPYYTTPAYVDPGYYSTPTSDPYYTTPAYVDPGYYSTPSSYVDPYYSPSSSDPYYYSTPSYDPYYYPSTVDPGYYSTPYVDPSYPSYTPPSDPYYTTPSDPYYYPAPSATPLDSPTSQTPHTKSFPSHPFCHLKIETFLIKVVFEGQSGSFAEYPYLISTPSDQANGYSFGSIGKSIYKPDAHPAVFWVTSGDLDYNTASLAEYYKGYPHHSAPSYDEAYYLWIVEEIIVVVYISLYPPSYADYTKFGVNSEHHLTYDGLEKWALCPPSGAYGAYDADELDLYWIGTGECPSGCIEDVTLYLVYYGFPYPKDTYYRNHRGIKSPTDTTPPSYYPSSAVAGVPAPPPYSTPSYVSPTVAPVPAYPPYSTPGSPIISPVLASSPPSYYYPPSISPTVAPVAAYPPYSTPGSPIISPVPASSPSLYYYPPIVSPTVAPVAAYPPYSSPIYPVVDDTPTTLTTTYAPVYTSVVYSDPVTYDTDFYDDILTAA